MRVSDFGSIRASSRITSCALKIGRPKLVELGKASLSLMAALTVLSSTSQAAIQDGDTLANVPPTLSGECATASCKKPRIQRPKSGKAERCTVKCVNTCIRGGDGSPGEGPLNIRGPLVVFKRGFRSRRYCLVECSDICNLLGDRDDGP